MIDQPVLHDSTNTKPGDICNGTGTAVTRRNNPCRTFVATGLVANARLTPLLPADWVDITDASRKKTIVTGDDSEIPLSEESVQRQQQHQHQDRRSMIPDFLWENSPRHETKSVRDDVTVYSHLPNGINILDSKWVLGRLFARTFDDHDNDAGDGSKTSTLNPLLATCDTHCFSGLDGFRAFARSVDLFAESNEDINRRQQKLRELICTLPDIAIAAESSRQQNAIVAERPPTDVLNWWVVKDAGANGAGGVWVVGPENFERFQTSSTSPLIKDHKYVAQQYVWPPVLYEGKKCHVRVYATVTYDGRAFVHKRAFLHVANDAFEIRGEDDSGNDSNPAFDDCIHITNCCANSHDEEKFAGEILADFGETHYTTWSGEGMQQQQPVVPLADFFPSVQATVSTVVQRSFRLGLLDGGQKNHGFEYCGMDFMLSYRRRTPTQTTTQSSTTPTTNSQLEAVLEPVAYLLEINSPPSQDTASSLPHAEDLHNEVLRDWMTCWVIPHIDSGYPIRAGGWVDCKVQHQGKSDKRDTASSSNNSNNDSKKHQHEDSDLVLPSKAAMLNKIRWALFERKMQKKKSAASPGNGKNRDVSSNEILKDKGTQQRKCNSRIQNDDDDCRDHSNYPSAIQIARFARSQFPFFSTAHSHLTDAFNNSSDSEIVKPKTDPQELSHPPQQIFFENAGGAQVPQAVVDQVSRSLARRHRDEIGSRTKAAARETLRRILVGGYGDSDDETTTVANTTITRRNPSVIALGLNATSLLASLGKHYSKLLTPADEVVIGTENHLANFNPWIEAATSAGAKIKLWAPFHNGHGASTACHEIDGWEFSSDLGDLVTTQTRIVAIPHASNVLGTVRPISALSRWIKDRSNGYAHVVVDGVAVAPHMFVGFDDGLDSVDWYVVSMHKLFGPHVGVLLARQNRSTDELLEAVATAASDNPDDGNDHNKPRDERIRALLETGTANIEGCAGIVGLGSYFKTLSGCHRGLEPTSASETAWNRSDDAVMVFPREVRVAYDMIRTVETALLNLLLEGLSRCPHARILDGSLPPPSGSRFRGAQHRDGPGEEEEEDNDDELVRLPTVSFVHDRLSSRSIYDFCRDRGIVCRNGFFLCTGALAADLGFRCRSDGVLRVSLAHYNTPDEVRRFCSVLESMPMWSGDGDS